MKIKNENKIVGYICKEGQLKLKRVIAIPEKDKGEIIKYAYIVKDNEIPTPLRLVVKDGKIKFVSTAFKGDEFYAVINEKGELIDNDIERYENEIDKNRIFETESEVISEINNILKQEAKAVENKGKLKLSYTLDEIGSITPYVDMSYIKAYYRIAEKVIQMENDKVYPLYDLKERLINFFFGE